ncbi:MAG: CoA-transferase [Desulfobacterales bacterium]|jgi:glutaconate CoA-transferase subunit A
MSASKLTGLPEAVSRLVPDGSAVALGTAQETLIPFAAGHEIIRQRKRGLTLIGPISDILFDQIIGAGCVSRVRAAWVGNVITGSGYNFRRAVESGHITVEDHSILTLVTALTAGKMGIPFMPTGTALGSDLYHTNPNLKTMECPFTGRKLTAVRAIQPDVTIIHAQRCDEYGNAHVWGNMGITREACLAGRSVIVTAEEIVAPEVITSDPNRVVTPGFRVAAVVHAQWGAHPSPAPGCYNRDHRAFLEYRDASRTEEAFRHWLKKWVDDVRILDEYQSLLGEDRLRELALKQHLFSEPVDYGY